MRQVAEDKREETTEEKRGAGRPTDCTPEIIERVAALVRAGNYVIIACGEAGICRVTYYDWLKRGETGEEPYATFLNTVTRAEQVAEATAVAQLRQAGQDHRTRDGEVEVRVEQPDGSVNVYTETWVPGDWRATEAYLRRRHTDRWGDKQRTEVVGDKQNPLQVEQTTRLVLTEAETLETAIIIEETEQADGEAHEPEVDEVHPAQADD